MTEGRLHGGENPAVSGLSGLSVMQHHTECNVQDRDNDPGPVTRLLRQLKREMDGLHGLMLGRDRGTAFDMEKACKHVTC